MPRLILIPGLAADHTMWRDQLEGLAAYRPVVSQSHAAEESIPAMAARVLADHEGELVLCGASMGGMIAMEGLQRGGAAAGAAAFFLGGAEAFVHGLVVHHGLDVAAGRQLLDLQASCTTRSPTTRPTAMPPAPW